LPNRLSAEFPGYAILEAPSVTEQWKGAPLTLDNETSATAASTPNGSTIFVYQNMATMNNAGSLLLTFGSESLPLTAPALSGQALVYIRNWQGGSLKVTNTSPGQGTPIRIQLMGPGMPGVTPATLLAGGPPIALVPGTCAQGNAVPRWMQLVLENGSGDQSIIALIGGPTDSSGNNAYLFGINFTSDTGPPPAVPPPDGYYATSSKINYNFQFNWGSSVLFCANVSGNTASDTAVVLRRL